MPKLSFIVPVYKPKLEVFEKCVKSLKDQALTDWETVFVLDGPCPDAKRIIKKHIKEATILELEHGGAQKARNAGGEMAKGEFMCFFDSDCIIEPGTSRMWVEQFEKHPEVGFIYSGYKFFGEKYAIESEPFDPWTLRVRNYISGCFPMRKELYPGWTEGLKSLQDWDMWLSLLKKAESMKWDISKIGMFVRGYGFSTAFPDPESISGKGCTPEAWLDRVDAVKKRHAIKDREVCVSSLQYKHDGLALAKLIDADYLDFPNDKPNRYKTIIQIGFSLGSTAEQHASIFQDKKVKKLLFWTGDNISEMYNAVSFRQIDSMVKLLNEVATQYCEDLAGKRLLERLGFKVEIMPLPVGKVNAMPLPEKRKWAVDIASDYSSILAVVERSLPDIPLEIVGPASRLSDFTGLIHFFRDRTLSSSIKRALLTGRHVISNVQQPYCGFIDDKWDVEKFIIEIVDRVRSINDVPENEQIGHYSKMPEKFLEAIR